MASIIKRTYKATTQDGRTVVKTCDHYSIQYRDAGGKIRRVKGYKDKAATKQLAAELERRLARGEQGLVDPFRLHKARPLLEHFCDWVADLRASGRAEKYVRNANWRMKLLIAGCGWKALGEVEPNSFMRWRENQKKDPRNGTRKPTEGETPREASAATLNQYLDTVCAFLNWCAGKGRIQSNALGKVEKVKGPKVRKRRALSDAQVAALLAAAPEERRLVYRVALAAGLRRRELSLLLWGDVGLSAIPAFLQLRAEATKAKRGDRVYLPATLAEDLRKYKPESAKDSDRVFPCVPSIIWWKKDLAAAGIKYSDEMGRQLDFHAGTRKTLCTRMNRSGVPLAVAMKTMRHIDARLTLVDYTDDEQVGVAAAVLPEVVLPASATPGAVAVS
jgi:integrase